MGLGRQLIPKEVVEAHRHRIIFDCAHDLATTMSKLLHFGAALDVVVLRATATPAKIAGLDGVDSTLGPPANAGVTLLELRDLDFEFGDTDGNTVRAKRPLIIHLTLNEGRVSYERPAE
jgi:predicted amidohydrolase